MVVLLLLMECEYMLRLSDYLFDRAKPVRWLIKGGAVEQTHDVLIKGNRIYFLETKRAGPPLRKPYVNVVLMGIFYKGYVPVVHGRMRLRVQRTADYRYKDKRGYCPDLLSVRIGCWECIRLDGSWESYEDLVVDEL